MPGIFISIEGVEGVGKSTAMQWISTFLTQHSQAFIMTREPGGTELAEKIRQLLLEKNNHEVLLPETELLLMFASRAQHVEHVILPALASGKWVISDRFVDASFAYQGGGRGIPVDYIEVLEKLTVKDIQPNLVIVLDAPVAIGLSRVKNRGAHDRIELEKEEFFERVRSVYLERAKRFPERYRIIDATRNVSEVEQDLKKILEPLMVKA